DMKEKHDESNEGLMSRRRALAFLGVGALAPLGACKRPSSSHLSTGVDASVPLHYLSLQEIGRRIAAREVSPVDLAQRMLERIAQVDAVLKSYATVMAERALAEARAAEQEIRGGKYRGPLHGVPIAVKDLCYT